MLQRASSDAGRRLRKSKSHTTVQQRRSASKPSIVHTGHARSAALEAYRRAYDPSPVSVGQVHSKAERNRKHTTRTAEGTHLAEARRGGEVSGLSDEVLHKYEQAVPIQMGRVGLRESPVAPAVSPLIQAREMQSLETKPATVRKTKSAHEVLLSIAHPQDRYAQDFQAPENVVKDTYTAPLLQPAAGRSDRQPTPFRGTPIVHSSTQETRPLLRQVRDSANIPPDKTSTTTTLRSYRSFTNPFKKKCRQESHSGPGSIQYDSSLPPFNFAGEEDIFVPHAARGVDMSIPQSRSSQRKVSSSLRDRFRRIFSRGRAESSDLPVQHVSAKQFHFNVATPGDDDEDTPPESHRLSSVAGDSQDTDTRARSLGQEEVARSRVTSWSSSAVEGTMSTIVSAKQLSSFHDLTPRNCGTTSNTDLVNNGEQLSAQYRRKTHMTSQESQQLYDALCHQISSVNLRNRKQEIKSSQTMGNGLLARAQREYDVDNSQLNQRCLAKRSSKLTIRAVTPDPGGSNEQENNDTLDHIAEKTSAVLHDGMPESSQNQRTCNSGPSAVSTALSECPSQPSARRLEKSPKRWQEPTRGKTSPFTIPKSDNDIDPYRLGSLPTSPVTGPSSASALHESASKHLLGSGSCLTGEVISLPNIYHDPVDGTGGPNIGAAAHDSVATITGREVKTYSLDPAISGNRNSGSRPSHEWRSWMSEQMSDMDLNSERNSLALDLSVGDFRGGPAQIEPVVDVPEATASHREPGRMRRLSYHLGGNSAANSLHIKKTCDMGLDYAAVDTGLSELEDLALRHRRSGSGLKSLASQLSDRGLRALRQISSSSQLGSHGGLRSSRGLVPPSTAASIKSRVHEEPRGKVSPPPRDSLRKGSIDATLSLFPPPGRQSPPAPLNVAETVAVFRGPSAASKPTIPIAGSTGAELPSKGPGSRPSIEFQVRIKRSKESLGTSSINIRRKKVSTSSATQFEDMTLQRITEGPYARSTPSPSKRQHTTSISVAGTPSGGPGTPILRKQVDHSQILTARSGTSRIWNKENETPTEILKPGLKMVGTGLAEESENVCNGNGSTVMHPLRQGREPLREQASINFGQDRDNSSSPGQKMAEDFLSRVGARSGGNGKSPGGARVVRQKLSNPAMLGSSPLFI